MKNLIKNTAAAVISGDPTTALQYRPLMLGSVMLLKTELHCL